MERKELEAALKEARDLTEGLSEISADGRRLAAELAETIVSFADLQFGAVDERLAKLRTEIIRLQERAKAA
ncbi:MAG: hypothetical protein AB7O04_03800 [Hyphomonadaceae bacterium]